MKLLVIEDNLKLAKLLRRGFVDMGHEVSVCHTGAQGRRVAETGVFDAIILDIGLPDHNGVEVCAELRRAGIETPLLMLTVLSDVSDKVRGLSAGADDYLTKPFDFEELTARLEALQRRGKSAGANLLRYGNLTVDLARRGVSCGDSLVHLTRREFDILLLFMRNPERILSRDVIGTALWGKNYQSPSNVVDVHVNCLRRKLDATGAPHFIQTVIGYGYVLDSRGRGNESRDDHE